MEAIYFSLFKHYPFSIFRYNIPVPEYRRAKFAGGACCFTGVTFLQAPLTSPASVPATTHPGPGRVYEKVELFCFKHRPAATGFTAGPG